MYNYFWAYVDFSKKIHVKRFVSDLAIKSFCKKNVVVKIFTPFFAKSMVEAINNITERENGKKF